jgi:hypothetical protein
MMYVLSLIIHIHTYIHCMDAWIWNIDMEIKIHANMNVWIYGNIIKYEWMNRMAGTGYAWDAMG